MKDRFSLLPDTFIIYNYFNIFNSIDLQLNNFDQKIKNNILNIVFLIF